MRTRARAGTARDARGRRWRALGLGPRLFAAMGLVVLAGAATLLVVAVLVAPQLFHGLYGDAGGTGQAGQTRVEQAFTYAVLLSLAVAVSVAVVAALAVTALVSRRIAAPVTDLAGAARRVAGGRYGVRVPDPGLGPEFAALAGAFNSMAGRLAATERTRQRLLADLAHDLRTPIASIEATVEAVADGVLPPDETTWAALADQAGRLDRLVADLGAVSQAEERDLLIDPAPRDLGALAAAAVAGASARYAAKGVRLDVAVRPQTPAVRVDPHRFAEALTNLLDNALRYTPPGGRVTVTTDRVRDLGQDLARLTVADTGAGFEPDEAPRLFERLYRTDAARARSTGGSGLGLTITRAIVNAHGGTVQGRSEGQGRGATFEVTLPASGPETRC